MTVDSAVAIGLLLPDVLGTYSDAGNATVLAQRLRWRGIPADVHRVTARDTPPASCDIYLLGGGEDIAQYYARPGCSATAACGTPWTRAPTSSPCALACRSSATP